MAQTEYLVRIHANLSYAFLIFALILNTMLFVLARKAEKLDSFRKVFFAYCLADIIFAIAHAISLMYWAHMPKAILFFPTGPLAYWPILTPIAFQLQALSYVFVMCLVCSTFIHRYKLVNSQARLLNSKFSARLINGLVFVPVIQWLFTCAVLMQSNPILRNKANQLIGSTFNLDFDAIYLVGVDSDVDPVLTFSAISLFMELTTLINVIILCGRGIYRFIKSSMTSDRSKRVQKHVLKLIIFQAVHPFLLLYAPSIINTAQLIFDVQFPDEVNLLLALCISIFPVTNPILTLLLSRELTAPLTPFLSKLGIRSGPNVSASAVTMLPNVASQRW